MSHLCKRSVLISVIVPVYNSEKTIEKCLNSLEKQNFKNFEVIIVDDGSIDRTSRICKKIRNNNQNFYYYFQTNSGISNARNFGIEKANGKWIMFVDSDDFVANDFCSSAYKLVQNDKVDIGMFNYKIIANDVSLSRTKDESIKIISKQNAFRYMLLDSLSGSYVWNKIYKASLFEFIKFESNKYYEDLGIMYKIFDRATYFSYTSKTLYFYVQIQKSISHSLTPKKISDAYFYRKKVFYYINRFYPSLKGIVYPQMISNSIQFLYNCEDDREKKWIKKFLKDAPLTSAITYKYKLLLFLTKYMPKLSSFIEKKKSKKISNLEKFR